MLEPTWIEMTKALHKGEIVHIVAYNKDEKTRIKNILIENDINLEKIDFVISETNDVWARDTYTIFTIKNNQKLVVANFTYDGYGNTIEKEYYVKDA